MRLGRWTLMRVLLSTAPFSPQLSYYLKFPRFPVLNLPTLAATLVPDHQVRIVSNLDCRTRAHRIPESIASFKPDVVGLSAPSALGGAAVLRHVSPLISRSPGPRFIVGGQHATAHYEDYLAVGFDAVVLGEGEITLRRLVDAWESGRPLDKIRGLAFRRNGETIVTERRDPTHDLDTGPLPARALLPPERSIYGFGRAAAIEASRGCPHRCRFCSVHGYWGAYREKSNDRLLQELEALASEGVREFLFVDHSFGLDPTKTSALARAMLDARHAFRFGAFFRADTIARSPDTIQQLARAGLSYAIVGFESYGHEDLAWMNKRTTPAVNRDAARILRRAGVVVLGTHVYFTPGSTVAGAFRTFVEGMARSDIYKAGAFAPLPGSPAEAAAPVRQDAVAGPALDCLHVSPTGHGRQTLHQAAAWALFAAATVSPSSWAKVLARDEWRRAMSRREYRGLAQRLAWIGRAAPE